MIQTHRFQESHQFRLLILHRGPRLVRLEDLLELAPLDVLHIVELCVRFLGASIRVDSRSFEQQNVAMYVHVVKWKVLLKLLVSVKFGKLCLGEIFDVIFV